MSRTRQLDLGRVVGLNSYELAVKLGKFKGTLEEYLDKEQQTFDNMVNYGEELKELVGDAADIYVADPGEDYEKFDPTKVRFDADSIGGVVTLENVGDPNKLNTTYKTIVGAINELLDMIKSIQNS